MARITSGLASLVGRLASFFRLDRLGFAQPGTQQPARARLVSVSEILAELRAENLLPAPFEGDRWVWSYLCTWVDTETGERVGRGVAWTVETDSGTNYRAAAAEARRMTLYPSDVTKSPPIPTSATVQLRCRRMGQPYVITTS